MDLGFGRVTWTCMICGEERDDADIAVATRTGELPSGGKMQVNVRHCADSYTCSSRADLEAGIRLKALMP